jgi:integrase/recombinase XerC
MNLNVSAYKDYLLKEKKYSVLTVKAYLGDIESFMQFLLHNHDSLKIEEVNYSIIRSWIINLIEQKNSNNSVNRKISSLKSFYKFLLRIKEIESTPLLKHKSLKTPKKIQIPFSENELESVFVVNEFPDDFEGVRNQLVIELLYATGMRRAELITLKLSNVDLGNKALKVLGKRNKERIIPLLDRTIDLINTYNLKKKELFKASKIDLLILSKKGLKISESFVYRLINDYFSTVSQKTKKSPHVLRHTFATHLLNNGADLNSVKELLGHASLSSTQIYTHSSLFELQKVYKDAHPRSKK